MLDINFIRENLKDVKANAKRRSAKVSVDEIVELDDKRKQVQTKLDLLRAKQNKESKGIFNSIKKLLECCKE